MKSKPILAAMLAAATAVTMLGSLESGRNHTGRRTARGTIVAQDTIVTDDGHEWKAATHGIDRGVRVVVAFNTRGTAEVEDDVVLDVSEITIGNGVVATDSRYYHARQGERF